MNKICKSVLLATTASLVSFGIPTGAQAESIYVCKLASGFFLAATADSACVYHGSVKMTWSAVGPTGPMGPQGVAGAIGDAGPAGPAGPTGPQGNSGPAGPMGAQGLPGPKGEPGTSITGAKGDKGDRGDAGPQGVQGPAGSPSPTTGYADNGDGTVTDYSTGLMWEKKDECAGAPDLSNPHCAANAYSWSITPSNDPDGTLYTDFLTKLNSRGDGVTVSDAAAPPCFAGHCDWRIPNVFELQSILVAPYPTCGATPCIDAAFGPTQLANYWSFSTLTGASGSAWYVKFLDGNVINNSKANTFHARAVRNGR